MTFQQPHVLWLLPTVLLLALLWRAGRSRAERKTQAFVARETWAELNASVSRTARMWKTALLVTGLLFAVIASSRPLWGTRERVLRERGIDLIVGLDVSESMLAEDVESGRRGEKRTVSRLEAAKRELGFLLGTLPGHRVGIMPFAGDAFLQCPLTSDYGIATTVLGQIDTNSIPLKGTSLARALEVANKAFGESAMGTPVLLLITDGEDHEGAITEQIQGAAEAGVRVFCLGIGSEEGALIRRRTTDGDEVLRDAEGRAVLSRLDAETLAAIADKTGGSAWVSRPGERLNIRPLADELGRIEQGDTSGPEKRRIIREERYQFPLAIALTLFLAEGFLSDRKRTRRTSGREVRTS